MEPKQRNNTGRETMNIGIHIQPLSANYGGLLQNYALQQVLLRAGHEVETMCQQNLNYLDDLLLQKKDYYINRFSLLQMVANFFTAKVLEDIKLI